MGFWYAQVIRPWLFRLEAEQAHELAIRGLRALAHQPWLCAAMAGAGPRRAPVEVLGLKFANHIGLAAGFDKNAEVWPAAAALGFGHVEIGTVTLHKQPGNPRPRLFRLPAVSGLINRMGFNNEGAEAVAQRLKHWQGRPRPLVLGVNIGKSKITPLDEAANEYLLLFAKLFHFADYFTINVSSPNTPGLRQLQDEGFLRPMLAALREARDLRAANLGRKPVPLLLKIAPDLSFPQIDRVLEVLREVRFDGLVATNTTLSRPDAVSALANEAGGLSGAPLFPRALEVVRYCARATEGRLPIIGCGGITGPDQAAAFLDAGASLVQSYTGWIYGGPGFARDLAFALAPRQAAAH